MVLSLRELKHVFGIDKDDEQLKCAVCNTEIKVGDDIKISVRHSDNIRCYDQLTRGKKLEVTE